MIDRQDAAEMRGRASPGQRGRRDAGSNALPKKRGDTLGLRVFEKISAVEGVQLSREMREDLQSLDARHMDEGQRSRFISRKYGKV